MADDIPFPYIIGFAFMWAIISFMAGWFLGRIFLPSK